MKKIFVKTLILFVLLPFLFPSRSFSQTVKDNLYVTNGQVNTIVTSSNGSTIYIGGNFTQVGPSTGTGVVIDTTTGVRDSNFPKVNGQIFAVVPDGSGGWFIGGFFTKVGGTYRNNIAHIKSDKTVDLNWNPNASSYVLALAISGTTLYVGGSFTFIGGQLRSRIAALDASTGNATSWNPNAGTTVRALAVSGTTIYVGGDFASIGGQTRNYIAAINTSTGSATSWNPNANSNIRAFAISGSTVYAGGNFTFIGGQTRNYIAALDTSTGLATSWNPNASAEVRTLAISGTNVYAGGVFTIIGGQTRNDIAALNASTGLATSWNPNANSAVNALAISGTTVYVGGYFTSIGGQTRNDIAALGASTGNATSWNPNANSYVYALAISGTNVYAGGQFTSIGGQTRNRIAAIDSATGNVTSWDPNANTNVYALAISGTTVYAGGDFTSIGGQTRNRIAALDASTGLATSWNPNSNTTVSALAISGTTVYVGGGFTTIGGQTRTCIAALDASTGLATTWNPNANTWVYTLAISGTTVYAGGYFTSIGGQARNYIAALNTSGNATTWNPNPNASGYVRALAVLGTNVYAGGDFTSIGGQFRNRIAAIDTSSTGLATSWNPNANSNVYALAISGTTVYAGGYFTSIGGLTRNNIAAINTSSGNVTPWNPNANFPVLALAIYGTTVYAGGYFNIINNDSRGNFAGMSIVANPLNPPTNLVASPSTTSDKGIDLSWSASGSGDVTSYRIYRSTATFTDTTGKFITQNAGTSYSDVTPAYGTYFYRLAARDLAGNISILSNETSAASPDRTAPNPPQILNAVAGNLQVTLKWRKNTETDFLRYRIYQGNFNPTTQVDSVSVVTDTTKTITGLTNGQTYYFRLKAIDTSYNASGYSSQVSAVPAAPVISGTKTIGPTGDYASLTAAFAVITSGSLSGSVILELQSTYNSSVETFPIVPSTNAAVNKTITVRPAIGATGLLITSNAAKTIDLDSTTYVTFDGRPGGTGSAKELTITNTGFGGAAVEFVSDARYNNIQFCNLVASTIGVIVTFSSSSGINGNSSNTISDCYLHAYASGSEPFFGVLNGTANSPNVNNIIRRCDIQNTLLGIYLLDGARSTTIEDCKIYNTPPAMNASGVIAIGIAGGQKTIIQRNKIYNLSATYAGSVKLNGIVVSGGSVPTYTKIVNNFISLDANASNNSAGMYGINYAGGNNDSIDVYYNTIYIAGNNAASDSSVGITKSGNSTVVSIKNNIVVNARTNTTGTGKHYAIYVKNAGGTMSYNDYLASGTGGVLGHWLTADYSTLSAYQTASGQEAVSVSKPVTFVNAASNDLHLSGGSLGDFNLAGTPVLSVTNNDIDSEIRNSVYPYMGADENTANPLLYATIITTAVYQNPALSKYFDIVVVTIPDLTGSPSVKLWITGTVDTLNIGMSILSGSPHVYKGSGEFTVSGNYKIRTRATLVGRGDLVKTYNYDVSLAKPGRITKLLAFNSKASLQINERSLEEETYFLSNYWQEGKETIYRFGPERVEFNEPLDVELTYEPGAYTDAGKLFIYQNEGKGWTALRSQVYPSGNKVKAKVTRLGEFKLVYDESFAGTNLVPTSFSLQQNYPNPFNPTTTIQYDLPEDGKLLITVYNILGQQVKTLINGNQLAGSYTTVWDATNNQGDRVATGIYFYRIQAGRSVQTKKMLLLR